ncbi:MAG: hypothetical protein HXY37_18645 [Chloroflexi bacterium]|nr:hypothetical protein [Chloroflexota bacterium]
MSISRFARADAAYQEEIAAQWRDWCAYLRAHLALLDARAAEGRPAFEHAESLEEVEARARAELSAIPAARRTVFDGVREARRQGAQADLEAEARARSGSSRVRPVDPDAVDRRVLETLLAEATGQGVEDGWGLVPMGSAADEWYRVDVAALEAAPSAAAYAASRSEADDRKRRLRALAGLVGGGLVLTLVWLLLPRGGAPTATTGAAITVNGTPVAAWAPARLVLSGSNGEATTLAVTPAPAWPPAKAGEAAGLWHTGSVLPLQLCVPDGALAGATSVRLIGDGDLPERVYTLLEQPAGPADLALGVCGAGDERRTRYGLLRASERPADLALGAAGMLASGQELTLQSTDLTGPGGDPTLPAEQARVTLDMRAPAGLDWPTLAPTLLLASGQALLPAAIEPAADGAALSYLIPLPTTPVEAALRVTTADGRVLRWRLPLNPPPTRDATLREALSVTAVKAQLADAGATELRITLENRGAATLILTPADLALTQGETLLSLPMIAGLEAALEPGATRTLTVSVVPGRSAQPLILRIGSERFQISWNP